MKILRKSVNNIQQDSLKYGFSVPDLPDTFQTQKGRVCLVKAIIIFCASLGTIGSIVSAFELTANMPLIILLLLAFSLLLAFLHYNHLFFNLCYPVIFFLFAFSIIQNRVYVNSGYQAITNIIREAYRDYFDLNYSRQTSEAINDRYLTITFALAYLGFFLIVLLNIAVSNYMSILFTILLTFPFLQFGLYIGKIPSFTYVLLLLFCYITTLFLKQGGHYMLSENKKKDLPFTARKNLLSYKGHGSTMLQTLLLSLILSVGFCIVSYPAMQNNFLAANTTSQLKASTDSTIRTLIQNGMFGFMNRYQGSGGISNGRLGGVSSVQSDYETDLEVTFVPTSMETVYLKTYTGATYTSNEWKKPDYDEQSLRQNLSTYDFMCYNDFTAFLESNRLALYKELNPHRALNSKMTIHNIDASGANLFLPYYSTNEGLSYHTDHSVVYGSQTSDEYTVEYYPYTQDFSRILADNYDQLREYPGTSETEKSFIQYYDMYCIDNYTDVPTKASEAVYECMQEIGRDDSIMEQIRLIQNYFNQNYKYSLSPGTTPKDVDFATFFLTEQKKGYCAHFATAGTLLCRAYGIPARYVEGYVIQPTNLADANPVENEKLSDWVDGKTSLEQTGIVTVQIPDANAHAWTEIYIDGFGWYPVDFTPPSTDSDNEEEYSIFQSLFSGLFGTTGSSNNTGSNQDYSSSDPFSSFLSDNRFIVLPLLFVIVVFIAIPLLYKLFVALLTTYRRKNSYLKGEFNLVLPYYYHRLEKTLLKKNYELPASKAPEALFELLISYCASLEEQTKKASAIFHAGLYSKDGITKEEADYFIQYTNTLSQRLPAGKNNQRGLFKFTAN